MCVIIDGYKLYQVTDTAGGVHSIAGFGNQDAIKRATNRGIEPNDPARWHEWYRAYAVMSGEATEQAQIRADLETAIWDDVANFL